MRFDRTLEFAYGQVAALSPLVRRVIARNPSPFTFHGTGTYIVGRGRVAVIDPGPANEAHIEALTAALAGEEVSHIVITHTHLDHSPAAPRLQALTGAQTFGFGPHGRPGEAVEEGADHAFSPDIELADRAVIDGAGWTLEAVHTPGHTSNHLCFALAEEDSLFPGDHVMGWSTTVVSPPDGDMAAYVASLAKLGRRDERLYYPTHGAPIRDPASYLAELIEHRRMREREIAACLGRGIDTIAAMVEVIYADVDRRLHRAAGRSVLAHLIDMVARGRASCDGPPAIDSRYRPR
jgi:glyoxylase-like metal-dependent hydrolase (beta-lactamase superfamily II)